MCLHREDETKLTPSRGPRAAQGRAIACEVPLQRGRTALLSRGTGRKRKPDGGRCTAMCGARRLRFTKIREYARENKCCATCDCALGKGSRLPGTLNGRAGNPCADSRHEGVRMAAQQSRSGFTGLVMGAALLGACTAAGPAPAPQADTVGQRSVSAPDYVIGPGDTLSVFVYRAQELGADGLPVRPCL